MYIVRYASFSLHFDSLNEAYGFPEDYSDKSFQEVGRRYLELADKYGFKYTIFIIGKDLQKPENRQLVQEWASRGHEIGNHTWSHPWNLGALKKDEIRREVEMGHEIISNTVGHEPRGFAAPAWSTSSELQKVLIDLEYAYDTSPFPSWLMYVSILMILLNTVGDARFCRTLQRKDFLFPLLGKRRAFYSEGNLYRVHGTPPADGPTKAIRVLPIPTNRYGIACWHTLVFVLPWRLHKRLITSCLDQIEAFYYVMHPADFIDRNDLDPARNNHWERLGVSIEQKREYLKQSIELILQSGREIVTLREHALKAGQSGSG